MKQSYDSKCYCYYQELLAPPPPLEPPPQLLELELELQLLELELELELQLDPLDRLPDDDDDGMDAAIIGEAMIEYQSFLMGIKKKYHTSPKIKMYKIEYIITAMRASDSFSSCFSLR